MDEPLSLVFVGPSNTAYAGEVMREIERLGLKDRVLMPGESSYAPMRPPATIIAAIRIFASRSSGELPESALLEATAAGRPILCSRRPPMPEFGGDCVL